MFDRRAMVWTAPLRQSCGMRTTAAINGTSRLLLRRSQVAGVRKGQDALTRVS